MNALNAATARKAYLRTEEITDMHPVRLVQMMFDRSITHLRRAGEAIEEGNPVKRGENLSKAIAIITELFASVPADQDTEAAVSLRSLYKSILAELPKVSAFGNREVLTQTLECMELLKKTWEDTAMIELGDDHHKKQSQDNLQQEQPNEPTSLSFSI
ncbi:MAG: flagellar export chaperone FliS [Desulfurivibrionaceae bacterium]